MHCLPSWRRLRADERRVQAKAVAPQDEASPTLKLDILPPEIIQMIFDKAGEGAKSSSHMHLCLISRFLKPFGEAVLYRHVNLVKQRKPYTSTSAGSISSNRTISFLEELLPHLKAPQISTFSLLTLDLASAPPSWVLQRLRQLLRRFRTSKAVLKVYIASLPHLASPAALWPSRPVPNLRSAGLGKSDHVHLL